MANVIAVKEVAVETNELSRSEVEALAPHEPVIAPNSEVLFDVSIPSDTEVQVRVVYTFSDGSKSSSIVTGSRTGSRWFYENRDNTPIRVSVFAHDPDSGDPVRSNGQWTAAPTMDVWGFGYRPAPTGPQPRGPVAFQVVVMMIVSDFSI